MNTTGQRQWKLNWKYLTDTDKSGFETLIDVTGGSKFPFYVNFGLDATPRLYRVRFLENSLNFMQLTKDAWALSVILEEEL